MEEKALLNLKIRKTSYETEFNIKDGHDMAAVLSTLAKVSGSILKDFPEVIPDFVEGMIKETGQDFEIERFGFNND